jgi:hypothetical protein
MSIPVVLAHGALGIFDELIFIGVAVIFIIMMIVVWIRSSSTRPRLEIPESEHDEQTSSSGPEAPDRFRLD